MIDIHSHFLPKIDDGSKSSDMSLQMLQKSYAYGIDVMVATPHFYIKQNPVDKFIAHRTASYDALKRKIDTTGVSDIPNIRLGAEVYYFGGLSELPDIEQLCIENTAYLLLEMPFEPWTQKVIADVERLVDNRKITPIIAHIDRYLHYQKDYSYIEELIAMGCVIQMNGDFINGFFTKREALGLLKDGVVSLLGSDCHNMDKRAPNLDKSFAVIEKRLGKQMLDKIDECGRGILGL